MEEIYESLFSSSRFFAEQLAGLVLPEVPEEGPWLVVVGPNQEVQTDDWPRFQQVFPDPQVLFSYCERIDDGQDPVLGAIGKGCLIGSELYTERLNAGYLFVILPDYSPATAQTNLGILELFFAEMRLLCSLLDKNNQLHHLHLNHLSRTSPILGKHS
ncbi:MAG TPA: hypothetical protein P5017_04095 [Anaerohalosphaeraceae bacterium]|jgi:hypothetical protein|nr:hypothetical protein [Anaerohalosphaeraceae bacterium]